MNINSFKDPQKTRLTIFYSILIMVIGAFLSFLFLAKTDSVSGAFIVGYFYAFLFGFTILFVQKFFIAKLKVFNPVQQWTLRTFIYTISLSAAYLAGLIFQSAILEPQVSFQKLIGERFWSSFVTFISSPFDLQFADSLAKEEFRALLIPFFGVIILIALFSLIGSFVEMRWQQNRQQQAVDRAELTALKAQIEPHFLFNALNTIASRIKENPEQAEQLLLKLSDILRYIFDNSAQDFIRIDDELSFLRKYIDLMQARFEQRLEVEWHQSLRNVDQKIPTLLFQPLIENALNHGWQKDSHRLKLVVSITENEKAIVFSVKDDGQGIEQNRLKTLPVKGHALANISDRLQLFYKSANLMKIDSEYKQGTEVNLTLPKGVT